MYNVNTNFFDENGVDLGKKLVSKDYLMSYYPDVANSIITPELWTWGGNSYKQLGTNGTVDSSTPVTTFSGGANWKQVECGERHVFSIKTDGTLWGWGQNSFLSQGIVRLGRLGTNTTADSPTPVTTFIGGADWKQVSSGYANTAAIKTDGTLWTWGNNINGQLGINTTTTSLTPVTTLIGGTNWKQVSFGSRQVAAIKTDGTLWTWGRNSSGQLGINTTTDRLTPVTTLIGGTDWKQVSCGYDFSSAIKTDGTLWVWGTNSFGQLGINATTDRLTPVTTLIGGNNWKEVTASRYHTAAIKTDGTLWTWGYNASGQLGINTTTNSLTPVTTFSGGTNWKQVSPGYHTAAIKTDGTLWTWGYNFYGALGNNTSINSLTPVTTFVGGTNWKQVACGERYTVAIRSIDTV